jgi:hypothetical protein
VVRPGSWQPIPYRPEGHMMPWGEFVPMPKNYDGSPLDDATLVYYSVGAEALCGGVYCPERQAKLRPDPPRGNSGVSQIVFR